MQIVNIPRKRMLEVAKESSTHGLTKALQLAQMDNIEPAGDHIPPKVRTILRWRKIDQYVHSPFMTYLPLYIGAIVYTAVVNGNWIIYGLVIISLLGLPIGLLSLWNRWTNWAHKKIQQLLSNPFIFVDNGKIYSNFPELNHLEMRLQTLDTLKSEALNSSSNITKLAHKLKEKLILLGESTNDPVLQDLENQHLRQQQLLKEAYETMNTIEDKRQHCLKVRNDLFNWVELDWIKRQANQMIGIEQRTTIWQQAAEMELVAHDLQLQLAGIQGELGNALAEWQTRHELSNI